MKFVHRVHKGNDIKE